MTTPLCDLHCKKPAQYRVSVKSKHYNAIHVSYLCEKHGSRTDEVLRKIAEEVYTVARAVGED